MNKVLIVEDDLKFQRLLQARLKKHGDQYEVILANNGAEALDVMNKKNISLLVTDIKMPKVDGITLLTHINEKYPNIPCIVMTAYSSPEIEKRFLNDTLQFLKKPFRVEVLDKAIIEGLRPDVPGGSLSGISVASFLQLILMEQKTCLLEVTSNAGEKGLFYFDNGEPLNAVYRELDGEEAAYKIITMEKPNIQFKNLPKKPIEKKITKELMGLIMEAMRRKDESELIQA